LDKEDEAKKLLNFAAQLKGRGMNLNFVVAVMTGEINSDSIKKRNVVEQVSRDPAVTRNTDHAFPATQRADKKRQVAGLCKVDCGAGELGIVHLLLPSDQRH